MKKSNILMKTCSSLMAFLMAFFPVMPVCADLPQGAQVVAGDVTINSPDVNNMNITASDHSIINWNSYNIGQNQTVSYLQPSSSAISLNRVVGITSSMLEGTLRANGQIWLVNPNGITMTRTFRADTAGLLGSSLNISNEDFRGKKYNLKCEGLCGKILNEANLYINGPVSLLGPQVINEGSITAPLNSINLAAGEVMALGVDANNRISVAVNGTTKQKLVNEAAVTNKGTLSASGGVINLNASVLNTVFDQAINNSGIIEADAFNNAGLVSLVANGGSIEQRGNISAKNGQAIIIAGGVNGKINDDGNTATRIAANEVILLASQGIGQANTATTTEKAVDLSTNNVRAIISGSGDVAINNVADANHSGDINLTQVIGNVNNLVVRADRKITAGNLRAQGNLSLDSRQGAVEANIISSGDALNINAKNDININEVSATNSIVQNTNEGNINVGRIATASPTGNTSLRAVTGSIVNKDSNSLIKTNSLNATAANVVGTTQDALKTEVNALSGFGGNGVHINNNSANLQLTDTSSVNGHVRVTNSGSINASNVRTVEQNVNLLATNGDITATNLVASKGHVLVDATTGNVTAGDIQAGRTAYINAGKAIVDDGSNATHVTGDHVTLIAQGDIGRDSKFLNVAAKTLQAQIDNPTNTAPAKNVYIQEKDALTVQSVTGNLNEVNILSQQGMEAQNVNGKNITLTANNGDVKLKTVNAGFSGGVSVFAHNGNIVNGSGTGTQVLANNVNLYASGSVGTASDSANAINVNSNQVNGNSNTKGDVNIINQRTGESTMKGYAKSGDVALTGQGDVKAWAGTTDNNKASITSVNGSISNAIAFNKTITAGTLELAAGNVIGNSDPLIGGSPATLLPNALKTSSNTIIAQANGIDAGGASITINNDKGVTLQNVRGTNRVNVVSKGDTVAQNVQSSNQGIALNIYDGNLTAGNINANNNVVTIAANASSTGQGGKILDDGSNATHVTGDRVILTAQNDIGQDSKFLNVAANTLEAKINNPSTPASANNIYIQEKDALTIKSMIGNLNNVKITSGQGMDAQSVNAQNVTLVANNGDVKLNSVVAGGTAKIQAQNGNILNNNTSIDPASPVVRASAITLQANNGSIGIDAFNNNAITVDTKDVVAVTNVGNINVINSATSASNMKGQANSGNINLQAKGDVKVVALASNANQVTIRSGEGSITNLPDSITNNVEAITAGSLHLAAAKDIGTDTAHLVTSTNNITANAGENIHIHENTDTRVFATAGKDLDVHSDVGNLDIARGASTTGNVSINAKSINAQDISVNDKRATLTATNGDVNLTLVNAGPEGTVSVRATNGNIVNNRPDLNQIYAKNVVLTTNNGSIGTGADSSKAINVQARDIAAVTNVGNVNVINSAVGASTITSQAASGDINLQTKGDVNVVALASANNQVTVKSTAGSIANIPGSITNNVTEITAGRVNLQAAKDVGVDAAHLVTKAETINVTAGDSIHLHQNGSANITARAGKAVDLHSNIGNLNIITAQSATAGVKVSSESIDARNIQGNGVNLIANNGDIRLSAVNANAGTAQIQAINGNVINASGAGTQVAANAITLQARNGSVGTGSSPTNAINVNTSNVVAFTNQGDVNVINNTAAASTMQGLSYNGNVNLQANGDVAVVGLASDVHKVSVTSANGSISNMPVSALNNVAAIKAGTVELNAGNVIGNSDPLIGGSPATLLPNALKISSNTIIAQANGIDAGGASITINNDKGVTLQNVVGTNRVNVVSKGDTVAQNVQSSNQGIALNIYDGNLTAGNIKADNQAVIINVNDSPTGQGGMIIDDGNDATTIASGRQIILNTDKGIGISRTATADAKYVTVDSSNVSASVRQQGDINIYNKQGMLVDNSATGNIKGNVSNIDVVADGAINAPNVSLPGNVILESNNNNVTVGALSSTNGIIAIGAEGSIKDDNNETNLLAADHILLVANGNIGDPGQELGDIDIKTPDVGAISTNGSIYLNGSNSPVTLGLGAAGDINVVTNGPANIAGARSLNGNINIQVIPGDVNLQGLVKADTGSVTINSGNGNIIGQDTVANVPLHVDANAATTLSAPNGVVGTANQIVRVKVNNPLTVQVGNPLNNDSVYINGSVVNSNNDNKPIVTNSSGTQEGNAFFNGQNLKGKPTTPAVTPTAVSSLETPAIIAQSLNQREPLATVDRLNQRQVNRGPTFSQSAIAPALLYQPISNIDTSAVIKQGEEFELEEGAFDFIDENLKKRKSKQTQ